MTTKVAFIIIYNRHQHADNIPVLEKIYGGRFSHIYHLAPVMRGFAADENEDGPNIISVSGDRWTSYHFSAYMAQGLPHYFREQYTHYFFINDDLFLNPVVNEDNFREHLKLDSEHTAFTTNFYTLHQRLEWDFIPEAYSFHNDAETLPPYDEALKKFSAHGLEIKPVSCSRLLLSAGLYIPPADSFRQKLAGSFGRLQIVWQRLKRALTCPADERKLAYPLVGGFADIAVIPAADIAQFCRYCEAFDRLNIVTMLALPTALALSCKKINTHEDVPMWGWHYWLGKSWEARCATHGELEMNNLRENFPRDCLFIHPVKLSQWNMDGE